MKKANKTTKSKKQKKVSKKSPAMIELSSKAIRPYIKNVNDGLIERLPTRRIKDVLKEMIDIEGSNKDQILVKKIRLGRLARKAQRITQREKIPFRTYVKDNFEDAVNRIYESIAIYRANKAGVDISLGGTVLMKIGQGMLSKNRETAKKFNFIADSKEIKTEEGLLPLSIENRAKVLEELCRKPEKTPKLKSLQKSVETSIALFAARFNQDSEIEIQQFSQDIKKWIQSLEGILKAK